MCITLRFWCKVVYNHLDIQIRNFNDNPIPDFYVGVVDDIGD